MESRFLIAAQLIYCSKKTCHYIDNDGRDSYCYKLRAMLDGKGTEYCSWFFPNGEQTLLKNEQGENIRCQRCLDSERILSEIPKELRR